MVRAVRTRWWPRFLLAGVVVAVAGVALFSDVAQFTLAVLGVTVGGFSAVRGLDRDDYYRHEPPVPPGGPGGPRRFLAATDRFRNSYEQQRTALVLNSQR